MRLRVPVTLCVALSVFAASAAADSSNSVVRNQTLRQTGGQLAMRDCSNAWAVRDPRGLDDIDREWRDRQESAVALATAAERDVAEFEKDIQDKRNKREELETRLANLTKGRDVEMAGLEERRARIAKAAAAFDGLAKQRKSIAGQLANPSAPVQDGFDSRRTLAGRIGGDDPGNASPRIAELQGQLNQVMTSIQRFPEDFPVFDPIPAREETSIRAALARRIVDIDRDIANHWKARDGDPDRINDLRRNQAAVAAEIDALQAQVGVAREETRIRKAFALGLERLAGVVANCTRDQREYLASRPPGEAGVLAPPPPQRPPAGTLTASLEADCGGEWSTGIATFRADPIPSGGGGTFTARLEWAFAGGPFGGMGTLPGMITPEGDGTFSTLGVSGKAMFLAVMTLAADGRTVVGVRGYLCGAIPNAGGNCRGHFWTPQGSPRPNFPEELNCPAQP